MSQITTVIFDMYETLVENSPHLWQATFQDIIDSQQLPVSTGDLWREWKAAEVNFRNRRLEPESPFESYFQGWRSCFVEAFRVFDLHGDPEAAAHRSILDMSLRAPYEETVEALEAIQDDWLMAVLSNADDGYLMPNVAGLGLNFAQVLSSEEGRAYKPEPGLFQEMLRRLDVTPSEAAYVGDRQFEDVLGAGTVGMTTVWINRTGVAVDPELLTPNHQIKSLLELPDILSTGE